MFCYSYFEFYADFFFCLLRAVKQLMITPNPPSIPCIIFALFAAPELYRVLPQLSRPCSLLPTCNSSAPLHIRMVIDASGILKDNALRKLREARAAKREA